MKITQIPSRLWFYWKTTRKFPVSYKNKMALGLWWIFEAIMIETPLYYILAPPYEQQILGPWNIVYFLSALFAAVYGAICFGLGYMQWRLHRYAHKNL